MATFKTIHPENRSELAQGDLDAIQKDIVMYLNDLSDDHIITLILCLLLFLRRNLRGWGR